MFKIIKLIFKIIGSILSFALLGCIILGIVVFVGNHGARKLSNMESSLLVNWQSHIKDETKINEIALPGSHDAGTNGMFYAGETQSLSIKEQLEIGVRYFDIRVNLNKDGELVIFHSILDGEKYENVVNDLVDFIDTYPSEFIVLDFQHFKNNSYQKTFELLESKTNKFVTNLNRDKIDDIHFIDNLTLKDVRGKFLVTIGADYETTCDKPYQFVRDNDSKIRENSILHSFYTTEDHTMKSEDFIRYVLPKYIEEFKKINSGLFVLQTQLTDKFFVFGPGYKENYHKDNLDKYLIDLINSHDLKYINIVMRDFLDSYKVSLILNLNIYKNIIKEDSKTFFNEEINRLIIQK